MKKSIVLSVVLGAVSSTAFAQGNLFITGHDSDSHVNGAYQAAGLDYLFFGAKASAAQELTRSSMKIGYLGSFDGSSSVTPSGYTDVTFIDLGSATWATTAFAAGAFDALVIGTGLDWITNAGSTALNSQAAAFASYFNGGGSLYLNSEQGIGQSFYDFLPPFGVSQGASINDVGVFTPTAAGIAIGLTDMVVDMDITHTTFANVPAIFTVFETYDVDGSAVAIGLRQGRIGGGGFEPGAVPEPSTYGLIGAGVLLALAIYRRRAKK